MRKTLSSINKSRPITQADIARSCGVARSTVSFVLNDDPRVSVETRRRVAEAIETLGYDVTPHLAARRLVLKRYGKQMLNRAMGLVLPVNAHHADYFQRVLGGVQDALTAEGFALVTAAVDQDATELPPIFSGTEIDALLLLMVAPADTPLHAQIMQIARARQIPIIAVLAPVEGFSCVRADDHLGGFLAVQHLLDAGHRHLLYIIVHTETEIIHERIRGMEAALRAAGLDPAVHLRRAGYYLGTLNPPHHLIIPQWDQENPALGFLPGVFAQVLADLRAHPETTAILAQNDPSARRLGYLLMGDGYLIPETISLLGYDDTDPLSDAFGHNQLTTVHVPLEEIGQEAVRLALRQVADDAAGPETVILPTSLTIRGSTRAI